MLGPSYTRPLNANSYKYASVSKRNCLNIRDIETAQIKSRIHEKQVKIGGGGHLNATVLWESSRRPTMEWLRNLRATFELQAWIYWIEHIYNYMVKYENWCYGAILDVWKTDILEHTGCSNKLTIFEECPQFGEHFHNPLITTVYYLLWSLQVLQVFSLPKHQKILIFYRK